MLSKFAGIKFISELKHTNRAKTGIVLVLIAWICLLVFALTPDLVGLACLFVNGFVLDHDPLLVNLFAHIQIKPTE